jgi:DeoR/GlpR family transcriptional regulator of sugar metabolism
MSQKVSFRGYSAPDSKMDPQEPQNDDYSLPARRQNDLLRLAHSRGQVMVNDLAEHFEVSVDTIRRDLDALASRGLLTRTHGGAVPVEQLVNRNSSFAIKMQTQTAEKRRIARAAADLIRDGETLIINGGSTTRYFAEELGHRRNLTVVTNNLSIPPALPEHAIRRTYVLGGPYLFENQCTLGPLEFAQTGGITVDTAVIGIGGLTAKRGLSVTVLEDAAMTAAMIASAHRSIVLADATKFGHNDFAHLASFARIHILVVDRDLPEDIASAMAAAGVEIIVVP